VVYSPAQRSAIHADGCRYTNMYETRNETAQTYLLLAASQSVMLAGSTVGDAVRASMEEIGGLEASG
jgi:hypothetical protein